ncbi:MAG: hypothetical protein ACM3SP_19435 [Chloroflexota bacterium]|jgi:hypothetical protein
MFQKLIPHGRVQALLLAAALGLSVASAFAVEGTVKKMAATSDGYCNLKIPAARPSTWTSNKPELKSSNTGDLIDFYGPCDTDPTSKDIVDSQANIRSLKYGKY